MRIAIGGASGMVGTPLVARLENAGHQVVRLVRRPAGAGEVSWDPAAGKLAQESLQGIDGIIHLGGENIAAGRWTPSKKKRIRDSRVSSTQLLSETAAALQPRPQFFVCASATGYYGHRGDTLLDENADPGEGFLAEVCQAWEAATQPAAEAGVRVVNPRIGVVLSPAGGALAAMLTPFRLGLGGVIGSGRQYWSAVALDELVSILVFCVEHDALAGPVNAVNPGAVTNREFTKMLGQILRRPTIFPLPAFAARWMLGEMADALLLASVRAEPRRLRDAEYPFAHTSHQAALQAAFQSSPHP